MDIDTEGNLLKKEIPSNSHRGNNPSVSIAFSSGQRFNSSAKKSRLSKYKNQDIVLNNQNFKDFCGKIDYIREIEEGNEDDFATAELFKKNQFEECLSCFYTIASILSSLIYYESRKSNDNIDLAVFSLVMVSIFNILFCK